MLGSNLAKRPHVISYIQVALLSYVQEKNKAASGVSCNFEDEFMTGDNGQMTKDDIRRAMTANIRRESDPVKQQKLLVELANLDALKGNNDTGQLTIKFLFIPQKSVSTVFYIRLKKNGVNSNKK